MSPAARDAGDWYKNSILYQIYPRSFSDSNGDGVGDLNGIVEKLGYLESLGVDGIWLSPIYTSPMADFGYDVSDYCAIDPNFGSLEDFDRLVASAHARGIKIIMDLVPNHTSDQHTWFEESRSSLDNPKRNWYIWKPAKSDGSLPNNWQSVFGGPAWTYDPKTDQYYLHSFLKEQPDLNWSNPEVQHAIQEVMRFWYRRGVDGFRVDAILFTSKDLEFRDNPEPSKGRGDVKEKEYQAAFSHGVGKTLSTYIKVLSDATEEFAGRCLFLEAYPDKGDPAGYAGLYNYINHEVAAPFYFALLGAAEDWTAANFRKLVDNYQALLPRNAFPVYVLGNHDTSRLASRIGTDAIRSAAVLLLTLPGTKFIYYGEELGMADVSIPVSQRQDPSNVPRDPERTPMRWSNTANAGFSSAIPWLPVGPGVAIQNVETLSADPRSILSLYRQIIDLCKEQEALSKGSFEPLRIDSRAVYGFMRVHGNQRLIVLANFTSKKAVVEVGPGSGELLLSSTLKDTGSYGNLDRIALEAHEAVIINLI